MSDLKYTDYERLLRAKFPKGEPADPKKNMSPEQAAEWDRMNAEHRDKFKSAGQVKTAGYTHYWYLQDRGDGTYGFTSSEWSRVVGEAKKIVTRALEQGIGIAGPMGSGRPMFTGSEIALNGADPEDYESFVLERNGEPQPWQRDTSNGVFAFCKTQHRPYDAVVVSILAAARKIAPSAIKVKSDGGSGAIKRVLAAAHAREKCSPKMAASQSQVYRWMLNVGEDYLDRYTDEVNMTALAEAAAHKFRHDEWLDDPDHWVWDLALKVHDIAGSRPYKHAADESDAEGKFEKGKPADPTENMTPAQKKKWQEENEKNRDKFKAAAEPGGRQRLTWAPTDKTAAPSGLYGYTKKTQRDVEASVRKIERRASKIARTIWKKDEQVASFLAAHAKRAKSGPARILMAALKGLGPKVANLTDEQLTLHERLRRVASELDPAHGDVVTAAYHSLRDAGVEIDRADFRAVHPVVTEYLTEHLAGSKQASTEKEAEYGLYGYRAKTATLGLNACSEIRAFAGQVAYDLHTRRSAKYDKITGFLREHSKKGRCRYSRLLLSSYPDRPALVTASDKTASVPRSPSDAWDTYVGDQSPDEFMQLSRSRDPESAVADYAKGHEFFADLSSSESRRVQTLLVEYIEQTAKTASTPSSVADWLAWED